MTGICGDFTNGPDYSIDVLGDDAKDGETVKLCKRCYGVWKHHPQKGKLFPGFTADELEGI